MENSMPMSLFTEYNKQLRWLFLKNKSIFMNRKLHKSVLTLFVDVLWTLICQQVDLTIEFFTNSPQHKNANIANFTLALPLEINYSNKTCDPEM